MFAYVNCSNKWWSISKYVETNKPKVVAIECFLKSPFACKIVKKMELKKLALITAPRKIERKIYKYKLSGVIYQIIGS